jgi:periplasmic divalent cation tolerance protein
MRREPSTALQEHRVGPLTALQAWSNVTGMGAIVIVTSVGTEDQANTIARELVARRHAACVNIVPKVRSVYRWRGKVCQDGELLLIIKTIAEEFDAVTGVIGELHSYDLPEILSFDVARGEESFLGWIDSSVDKDAPFEDDEEPEA